MSELDAEQLQVLRALLAAATPGRLASRPMEVNGELREALIAREHGNLTVASDLSEADADLYVAVKNWLPDLLDAAGGWRCFQCKELFTDYAAAEDHFTLKGYEVPACVDPLSKDEKARIKELRDARAQARQAFRERDAAESDRALLRSYQSEIGRLFGSVGGTLASTPREAWLVLDAKQGEVLALREQITALRTALESAADALANDAKAFHSRELGGFADQAKADEHEARRVLAATTPEPAHVPS